MCQAARNSGVVTLVSRHNATVPLFSLKRPCFTQNTYQTWPGVSPAHNDFYPKSYACICSGHDERIPAHTG